MLQLPDQVLPFRDSKVIIHRIELSLGHKDLVLELHNLQLLLFDLQPFIPDQLILFLNDIKAEFLLFAPVFLKDFIELFGQFVDLCLELDVLLD